jgi:hypothetical protein
MGFWWTIYQAKSVKDAFKRLFSLEVWIFAIAFVLPILISVLYYYAVGAGEAYTRSALMQNIGYLSSWEKTSKPIWENALLQRGVVWLGVLGVFMWQKKRLGERYGMAGLWFGGALFGALLSGRPYPHYMLEIVAPACLILSLVAISRYMATIGTTILLTSITVFSIFFYKFWYYKSLPYYRNFIEYRFGMKTNEEYMNFFGSGVVRNFQIAEYVKKNSEPNDKIYVWGTEPAIYAMSDRLPSSKYTVAYHVVDFNGYAHTLEAIERDKPVFIVWFENESAEFKELAEYVSVNYVEVKKIGEAIVYRKTAW